IGSVSAGYHWLLANPPEACSNGLRAKLTTMAINFQIGGKQVDYARSANLHSDIHGLFFALKQYKIDNKGTLPITIPNDHFAEFCSTSIEHDCQGLDINFLVGSYYIMEIPQSPYIDRKSSHTDYGIKQNEDGNVTIKSLNHDFFHPSSCLKAQL
ncbi:MAG: hypothetical protein JWM56_1065, partial [Candidatus Peribacteria bacterium]|nr:hypothetical protein [Candidatus Peribacteria bacterium]